MNIDKETYFKSCHKSELHNSHKPENGIDFSLRLIVISQRSTWLFWKEGIETSSLQCSKKSINFSELGGVQNWSENLHAAHHVFTNFSAVILHRSLT